SEQTFDRDCAKRHDNLWLNNLDLLHQIRAASLHLLRCGYAISKSAWHRVWSAFENIGDVNVFAGEVHRLENFGQQLSGASDKWFALFILIHAGRFADEHQVGVRISYAENGLRARAGEMRAFRASANPFPNRREQLCLSVRGGL